MGIFNKKSSSLSTLQQSTNTVPETPKPIVKEEKITEEVVKKVKKEAVDVAKEEKKEVKKEIKKEKKEVKKELPEEIEDALDDVEDIDDDIEDISIDEMLEEQPDPEDTKKKKKSSKPAKKPKSRAEEIQEKLSTKDLIVLKVMGNELLRFEGEECKEVKIEDLERKIINDFGMREYADGFTWNLVEDREEANTCYLVPLYKFNNKG